MSILNPKKIDADHIKVTLKPIKGIKPNVYIPFFYLSALILLATAFFIYPSMKHGPEISIKTYPSNASVYIDNVRIGSTPLITNIPRGNKELVIVKSNFLPLKLNINTLKNNEFKYTLISNYGAEILKKSYSEMARWSLVNNSKIDSRYRLPFIMSESVKDYFYSTDFRKEELNRYLKSSLKLVTNEHILGDYLRAQSISASDKKLLSISSVKNMFLTINDSINNMPYTPHLFYTQLLKNSKLDIDKNLYKSFIDRHKSAIDKNVISFDKERKSKKYGDLTLNYIPDSQVKPVDVNFIHNIKQSGFYISDNMISRKSFMEFINDNPYWSRDNIENLIEAELVDRYYLDFQTEEDYITNISYYAAKEWCIWANEKYNFEEGWKLTLPTENMWHAAVLYEGVKNIEAWQWTSQGFYLYDHFLTDPEGQFTPEYKEIKSRLVVGKNKYNSKEESGRGVQDSDWCTPFLSFRPVLIKD